MNFNDNKAIYLQIADKIMDNILSKCYATDSRIPSVREFAATVEVNANTVMRAYELLERDGIIYNRRGIGFFVSKDSIKIIHRKRSEIFFKDELPYFFSRLASLGINPNELLKKYIEYITNNRNENNN